MTVQYEVHTSYGAPTTYSDAQEAASYIAQHDDYINNQDVDIDSYLDDLYGRIEINGQTFWASQILYNLDEDSYYDIQADERQNAAENSVDYLMDNIENLDPGETTYFEGGITVTAIEVPDEDDEEEIDGFNNKEFDSIFK